MASMGTSQSRAISLTSRLYWLSATASLVLSTVSWSFVTRLLRPCSISMMTWVSGFPLISSASDFSPQ